MTLIIDSLLLSFGVCLRMILPTILISMASIVVWFILGLVTLGLANHVSGPVTTVFISLFGMRVALAMKGDLRRTDFKTLALYSIIFGVLFTVALATMAVVASIVSLMFTLWQLGEPMSLSALTEAAENAPLGFAFLTLGSDLILIYALIAAGYTTVAIPMASAARAAGQGAPSRGFFFGFGRNFLPLLCVFVLAVLLQFFFDLFTVIYAELPLVLSVVSLIITGELPDFDLVFILKGLAAGAALLWINAWMWSASALALLQFDNSDTAQTSPRAKSDTTEPAPDIRALRKSRERSF